MKKNFILFLLTGLPACLLAQTCPPNNVSTNPSNPISIPSRPDMANSFQWENLTYRVSLPANPSPLYQHPTGSTRSPWDQPNNIKVDRFRNNLDYKWQDGWEIITKYNGYDNQNALISPPQFEHPYVVLYNRYSGLLRVFFAFAKAPTQALFNGAKFEIKFVGTLSNQYAPSLLDLVVESPMPLSKGGANVAFGEAMMDYDNIDLDWFFADFPMQYDPCTCLYASKLQIKPLLISCNDLELKGTITGTLEPIKNNRVQDSKAKFSYGQAIAGYKKVNNTYKDVASIVNDINVKSGKVFENDQPKKSIISNAVNSLDTALGNGFKGFLKSMPWVGAALGFMDFFTGLGKKPGPQQVQLSPMSIDMTASLKGTLCGQGSFGSIIVHTPGSSGIPAIEKAQYPVYNEILGVFNLIDSPHVITRQTQTGVFFPVPQCQMPPTCPMLPIFNKEYRLKQPIKYALNPAAGIEIKEVQGAFLIETNDSTTLWNVLGKNSITGKWLKSTRLYGIDSLSDYIFNFPWAPSGGPGVNGALGNVYLQIVIKFTRIGDTTGILYSARYPLQAITHVAGNPATDIGTVTNGATPNTNYFIPLTSQEISNFCTSTKYKDRSRQYTRVADNLPIGKSVDEVKAELSVYPNPASEAITIDLLNPESQQVSVIIANTKGQRMKAVALGVLNAGFSRSNVNISGLASGIYFVTIKLKDRDIVQKIVVRN